MTVNNPPSYLQNDGPSAEQHRAHITAVYGERPGVIGEDDLTVSEKSGTPDMSVDVAGGRCLVKGGESTYQGLYLVHNRGTENVTISPADATNARKDLVVARVRDSSESGATDSWDLFVVEGTPAASPVPDTASIPDNAHVLALVDVAALATSIVDANITDLRKLDTYGSNDNGSSAMPGGLIQCLSTDKPLDNLYTGMRIYLTDKNITMVYDGTNWYPESSFVVDQRTLASNQSASTSWATILDLSNNWTAPSDGKLVVTCNGRTGFNAASGYFIVGIGNNTTTPGDDGSLSETFAGGGDWGVVSCATTIDCTSGNTFGYSLQIKADLSTGSQYWRVHLMSVFYPSHLFEVNI